MRQLTISRRTVVGRTLLLVTGTCALTTLLTSCGKVPDNTPDVFVVLASATANEPAPELAATDLSMLTSAAGASTQATAYIVNPTTGAATTVSLTPRRPDGQVDYGPSRDSILEQNVSRVQQLAGEQAASGPFDLLDMIGNAVRATARPGTLLIVSSGLSTSGGFDLRQVGWDADPAAIAATLKQRGLLPDLTGWQVIFSGLGDTYGRQPALPLPQRATLTGYWLAICRAAGAARCGTDDLTRPSPPPHSTTPVPVVPIPTITSIAGPKDSAGISVPSDALFAFDSAALLPGADSVLGPLAAQARANGQQLSITGYASPDGGSAAYNKALSERRALAVQARLISLGVPARQIASVTGLGTAGENPQACQVNGQLDEAKCALLRRVVILLYPRA
jgi:outer membrane protein OmpA-like peptidoglycan-associated protein